MEAIEDQGGVVRADGRLLMHGPGDSLLTMDESWTSFAPVARTPGDGRFELLWMHADDAGLLLIGPPRASAETYLSADGGDKLDVVRRPLIAADTRAQ